MVKVKLIFDEIERIESSNRLIEGARRVVGGLVVLEHSHGLLVGGEVTLLAAIDDLLAADAANSATRAADGLVKK